MNSSSYTLIGTIRSPFVRICRMLMIQNKIDFEFRVLNFLEDKDDAAALARLTPINKVPILLDGDQKIYDSRVIVNFLTHRNGLQTLSLDEENLVSIVYGCLDTGVILFLMKRDGLQMDGSQFFVPRLQARISDSLNFVADWALSLDASNPEHWNYPAMALYSFLYWAEARSVIERDAFPRLDVFRERFQNAPGVEMTNF